METDKELESKFNVAMISLYEKMKKDCPYEATRLFKMLKQNRGLRTAKKLVNSSKYSYGFFQLMSAKKPELTVENLITQDEWKSLFEPEEIVKAKEKLQSWNNK